MTYRIYSDASCTDDFKYAAIASVILNEKEEYVGLLTNVHTSLTPKLAELRGLTQVLHHFIEEQADTTDRPSNDKPERPSRLIFHTDSIYVLNVFNHIAGVKVANRGNKAHCSVLGYKEEEEFARACELFGVSRISVKHIRSHQKYGNYNKVCDLLVKVARTAAQELELADKIEVSNYSDLRGKHLIDLSPKV